MAKTFVQRDCTEEATALFTRFVYRHGFSHTVDTDAPVEVMWHIPAQNGLSLPLTLGLQNWDELNLGVEDFWSYFFPFDDVAEQFELILDKWVAGDARILAIGWRGRDLQMREGETWKTVYASNLRLFSRKVKAIIQNDPSYSNSTMT